MVPGRWASHLFPIFFLYPVFNPEKQINGAHHDNPRGEQVHFAESEHLQQVLLGGKELI